MTNLEKTETLQFSDGEWDAITAPFLNALKDKDPDYIRGFIEGIAYRFQLNK